MTDHIKYSYRHVNNDGFPWFFMANQLLHAGLKLREISVNGKREVDKIKTKEIIYNNSPEGQATLDYQSFRQATILIGFSIENALKGIIVNNLQHDVGDKLRNELRGRHDLENLADTAGIELSQNEKLILRYFTESIVWSGRYPIPVNDSEYVKHFKSKPGFIIENDNIETLPNDVKDLIGKINELI